MPLNPELYGRLEQRFGRVKVAKAGETGVAVTQIDAVTRTPRLVIVDGGEEYAVSCPFCGDVKQHLYINHRYGQIDPTTGREITHLVKCFRCPRPWTSEQYRELSRRILGFLNVQQRRQLGTVQLTQRTGDGSGAKLQAVDPPGTLYLVNSLLPGQSAARYLVERGFDLNELAEVWKVSFCVESEKFPMVEGKIIIPFIQGGLHVGWQGRYPGQTTGPKYLTMQGLAKRLVLYSHDVARQQPCVVISEGVTDCWKIGPAGVALLGKTASAEQIKLLAAGWPDKPAIVLLDGDAKPAAIALEQQMKPYFPKGVVRVELPQEADPGSMSRQAIWSAITEQAAEQGIEVPVPTEPTLAESATGASASSLKGGA